MIDLHSHSTASDGTYAPSKLVKYAQELGLTHLALTDHDTVAGLDEFLSAEANVEKIPGIELSVDYSGGELHIVGLFIDKNNSDLQKIIYDVQHFRRERNVKMLERLSTLMRRKVEPRDLSEDEHAQIGRPHMAKYLVKNRVVDNIQEAFSKYLGSGGILNVEKEKIEVKRAFDAVRSAGGLVMLAHPTTLNLEDGELDKLVAEYKKIGLDGMEVYSSHASHEKKEIYLEIAKKNDLLISCGSDFHGGNSSVAKLGADTGETTPEEIIENIYSALEKIRR